MTEKNTLTFSGRIRSLKFALRGIRIMVASQHNAKASHGNLDPIVTR